jgi:hypothetical protein
MHFLLAYPADIFSFSHNLTKDLGTTAGDALLVVLGVMALVAITRERHAAAVLLVIVGIIPALLLLDPSGASQLYHSTVAKLGH